MRIRPSRFLAAASALFLSALALQQCSPSGPQPTTAEGQAAFQVVATNDQIMDAIVVPASQAVWDSIVYTNGELVASPKTDDDWYNLQMNGYALAEAGNLMKIAPRARDDGEWMKFSTALTEQSRGIVRAAEAKDIQAMLVAGGNVYTVCTDCHRMYVTPDPNAPQPEIPGLGPGGPVAPGGAPAQ